MAIVGHSGGHRLSILQTFTNGAMKVSERYDEPG
uniref:Uncharacterized protein n=1 Tax=Anopheles albimanus TaxID=7167 RepID=A0A182FZJ3_ANOAL